VSFGVVEGVPQPVISEGGSGAVAQAAPDPDGDAAGEDGDGALEVVAPLVLHAAATRATAHAATRRRGKGMPEG
jgi:hypothetical protein